jgi:hypothetical protein
VKKHIRAQVKSIAFSIVAYLIGTGQSGYYIQIAICLQQSIVNLIDHPDIGLQTGKGRIGGTYA